MIYLQAAIILMALAVLVSIVWYSVRTGISPMPSSAAVQKIILDEVDRAAGEDVIDAGSGWGTLLVRVAARYPERKVTGYELSPVPWLVSYIRKKMYRLDNCTIYRRDFLKADLSDPAIMVCYLYPGGMRKLEKKLEEEKTGVHTVISSTFAFPSFTFDKVIDANDMHRSPVYVYSINSLDVPSIKANISTGEVVQIIREGRER
ncbi:MAG: SAM-dependent methyltransferase [Spirochaetota bacterium]